MKPLLRSLDELLRGRRTLADDLRAGQNTIPLATFLPLAIVLGVIYGFCMGWFGVLARPAPEWRQLVASTAKVPALFILTLVVTFPSLYVFNTLVGCRLSFASTLRLLVAAIVVNLAVAASFGTILVFFTICTTSYSFMVLLNVLLLGIAGMVGLGFLLKILRRLTAEPSWKPVPVAAESTSPNPASFGADAGPGSSPPVVSPMRPVEENNPVGSASGIFRVWVLIYGLVGAQMGWLLRPFIGNPAQPFAWFRPREGNVFQSIVNQLATVIGVDR